MQERRTAKRKLLMFYSRVVDRHTGELIGHLADLTPEGALLLSARPVQPDTVFNFHMELPDDTSGRLHLKFEAKSRWCQRDPNLDGYAAGFQLLGVPRADAKIIERLVEMYAFRDH